MLRSACGHAAPTTSARATRVPSGLRTPAVVPLRRAQSAVRGVSAVRHAVADADLQRMLEGAMARSSCSVGDRVGIIGLKFVEESLKSDCPIQESAIRLSLYLRDYKHKAIRGRTVLELGTGIGVAGITAAAFGANVLLTDLSDVVQMAAKNLEKNADLVRGAGGLAQVAPLDWGAPSNEIVSAPWEYVIGSDLVYDERSPDALAPLLARILAANPRANVFLAHVHRTDAIDDHMTDVFAAAGLDIRATQEVGDDISVINVRRK